MTGGSAAGGMAVAGGVEGAAGVAGPHAAHRQVTSRQLTTVRDFAAIFRGCRRLTVVFDYVFISIAHARYVSPVCRLRLAEGANMHDDRPD